MAKYDYLTNYLDRRTIGIRGWVGRYERDVVPEHLRDADDRYAWLAGHYSSLLDSVIDMVGEAALRTHIRAREMTDNRAALQEQSADAPSTAMGRVADRYAHVMAMHLECILLNYDGEWAERALQTLSEYRDAMNKIHETESPTYMGEPLLDHARRIDGEGK